MNLALWMLSGALVGWLAYSVLGFNEARGRPVSAVPGDFSVPAVFFAIVMAAAFLAIGDLLHTRWGL
jgi:hypothetical protein